MFCSKNFHPLPPPAGDITHYAQPLFAITTQSLREEMTDLRTFHGVAFLPYSGSIFTKAATINPGMVVIKIQMKKF
jgi:hypothetical protein